jgi:SAM-dependent methyltransferase
MHYRLIEDMERHGLDIEDFEINALEYQTYVRDAGELYAKYHLYHTLVRSHHFIEKSLEHFVAAQLLELESDDVYVDVASARSPAPEIYHKLYGCTTYRQDMIYPDGIRGNVIGGNAAEMPLKDHFFTKMALHCSFEHFEDDSDIRFIKEAARLLRTGGRLCILPLYLRDTYTIHTDPAVFTKQEMPPFEKDAVIYCARGYGNRHGRIYDIPHLIARIVNNMDAGLSLKIYNIQNAAQIDRYCYLEFAAIFEKGG